MQIAAQHSQNLRRLSATFFVRLALIVVTLQLPSAVLAQTPGPRRFCALHLRQGSFPECEADLG